jgi:hypothetical protein
MVLSAFCLRGYPQTPRFQRVETNPVIQSAASPEALAALSALLNYVKNTQPNIVDDEKAQQRFLSKDLRRLMMDANSAWVDYLKANPTEKPDGPNNAWFIGVWDQPETYSIVSARQYDYRNITNEHALRTMIDVLYVWGKVKNEYPGVRSLRTFIFVFEDRAWKLDDIYVYHDEFRSSESLRQSFWNDRPYLPRSVETRRR